jgi:hypothetical protein
LVMNPSKADMTKDFLKPTDLANSNKKTREWDASPCEPHSLVLISETKPKHYLNSADMKEAKVWAVEAASQTWEVKYKWSDTKVLSEQLHHICYMLFRWEILLNGKCVKGLKYT